MRIHQQIALAAGLTLAALPAWGQIAVSMGSVGSNGEPCKCTPQQRAPYLAEFTSTTTQVLADGTTISRETKSIEAQDSQGRHLNTNEQMGPLAEPQGHWTFTNVIDPVENIQGSWNSTTKEARLIKQPPLDQRNGCWASDEGNVRFNYGNRQAARAAAGGGGGASAVVGSLASMPITPVPRPAMDKPVMQDLGTDVIQGVEVKGHRMTRTIPVGQIGNDRPIVTVNETWMAPSLGIVLRSINDDPRNGKQVREATSLSLGDPDPAVFQPPEGYKVTVVELHEVPCQQNSAMAP
jgi:hypothetical protein